MTNPKTKGNGRNYRWLADHASYSGDDCLIWPFGRVRGYGFFCYLNRMLYAHRFMCELVHGPAPTSRHQAAHSCGRGHDGCVNPKHLSWKTNGENQIDRRLHGTTNAVRNRKKRLTVDQVSDILSLKGTMTQDQLAQKFNTCRRNIGAILSGKTWTHISALRKR